MLLRLQCGMLSCSIDRVSITIATFSAGAPICTRAAGITVFVPKSVTSGATADGRFGKDDFIYDASKTNIHARRVSV